MKVKHYPLAKRRQIRVRSKITGTALRPRLSLQRSNLHLSVQVIDDQNEKTLFGISTKSLKTKGTKTEKAIELGKQVAEKAKELKIEAAVLDRGSYRYHGRIKAFADSARQNGLTI